MRKGSLLIPGPGFRGKVGLHFNELVSTHEVALHLQHGLTGELGTD